MIIEVTDYPVHVKVGYYASERLAGQDLLVSLIIELASVKQPSDEDLTATIDYAEVLSAVDIEISGQSIELLETVVRRLGASLLKRFSKITHLQVRVEKPVIPNGAAKGAKVVVAESFKV